jgi:hypothetical protein
MPLRTVKCLQFGLPILSRSISDYNEFFKIIEA